MDSNHWSTGYEPVGISWLPYPASYFTYNDVLPFNDIITDKCCDGRGCENIYLKRSKAQKFHLF